MVIMEALALGRPVISTTIAGIPELVDESCGVAFFGGRSERFGHCYSSGTHMSALGADAHG